MKTARRCRLISRLVLSGALTLGVACADRPEQEIQAARRVGSQESIVVLDQELAAQDKKFALFRSYTKTKEIAAQIVKNPQGTLSALNTQIFVTPGATEVTLDCTCTCRP